VLIAGNDSSIARIVAVSARVYYGPMQQAARNRASDPGTEFTCTVTTLSGIEQILSAELTALGIPEHTVVSRAIAFQAGREDIYRCLHQLRTGLRVLVHIGSFEAHDADELYRKAGEIPWNSVISGENTFAVSCTVASDLFHHSGFAALKLKDAVVDQFRARTGRRPNVEPEHPDVRLHLHIEGSRCTVSRDAAGDSLHKRGYRLKAGDAPLTETLAAGLLGLSGFSPGSLLVDPFCGSGTIVIEAALMALGIPPGELRTRFGLSYGCERWLDFDSRLWKKVTGAESHAKSGDVQLFGFDLDQKVIAIAQENARRAGVDHAVHFQQADVRTLDLDRVAGGRIAAARSGGGSRLVVANPPYGERLVDPDLGDLYRATGDTLKRQFAGFDAWVLSGNFAALKQVGLRSERRIPLMNGPLECRYVHFKLREKQQEEVNRHDDT